MKITLATLAFMLMSFNSFADFSTQIIGKDSEQHNKDFNRNNIERLHQGLNEIILTFDDGPTPVVTNAVLDVLKTYNVKATFFVIANKAQKSPEVMKRILNEGHTVANHSLSHDPLKDLGPFSWKKKVKKEILDAHTLLLPYMKNSTNFYFRAPEGAWGEKFADYLNKDKVAKNYIGPVLWDIGGKVVLQNGQYVQAADWSCWQKKMTIDECLTGYMNESKMHKGGVVLMHDLRIQSAEMLAKFIPQLLSEGFTFKNLDDVDWDSRK